MKFLVDAQLPFLPAVFLNAQGFDVIHTDDHPDKEILVFFQNNLTRIIKLFKTYSFIELSNRELMGHE